MLNADDCDERDATVTTSPGDTCDDGDPNTVNDQINASCICAGTNCPDADGDGVCDDDDNCPNESNVDQRDLDLDGLGDACDDDIDGDGVPNADDCDPIDDAIIFGPGDSCDDNDASTVNDVYSAACICAGTSCPDADGDGVCDDDDICPGFDDNLDADSDGTPDGCDTCDGSQDGMPCDDGDDCTTADVFDADCNCAGVFSDTDGDGVCDFDDVCTGSDDNIDSDGDGIPDGCDNCDADIIGTSCDDGDPCTTVDIYDANCDCLGTFTDSDGDGVCDADDMCPGFDDNIDADANGTPDGCDSCDPAMIGTTCDDGDPCTTDDTFNAACDCTGTLIDSDGDGVCDADDRCPGFADSLIGTPCDDGDPCTVDEVFDDACNCIATTIVDCDTGDLVSISCDDGNPTTVNDIEVVIDCSGEVCIPCTGTPATVTEDLFFTPNIFSPNRDGINDRFTISFDTRVSTIVRLEIFDRWGNLVFQIRDVPAANFDQGWDGTFRGSDVPNGVYVFVLEVSGENVVGSEIGDISLFR